MSGDQEIVELEKLCEQLYNANSTQQIQEANKVLENFANSQDCLNKCKILLDRGIVSEYNLMTAKIKHLNYIIVAFY